MKRDIPSPELHLGLTYDADHDSKAWFLAMLPRPCIQPLDVTIHFGLVGIGHVLLPLFFLRMSCGKERLLLETSLNPFHADLQGLTLLRRLCTQASYQLQFRGPTINTEDNFNLPNTHHALYRQAVELLEAHPPWTATQFVQAQYHLTQSWSTPEERYKNLQCPPSLPSSFHS